MNKILIFTASTGGGHNQVAKSLESEFKAKGYDVVKLDVLKEISKVLDVLIADGYRVLATNMPKMYGGLYKISDKERINNRITKLFTKITSDKVYDIIKKNSPDLIIGTHPFIVNVIGRLKENRRINLPFISVVTDFQAHQTYINKHVDAYITGSCYTEKSLIKRGIPREKIYPYGIPVRREFLQSKSTQRRKKDKYFTVLLMGGSMGVKSMKKALKNLVKCTHPLRIIAICGNNQALKKSIEKKYVSTYKDKKIFVYGYTQKVPQLMDVSDIIITKPGGITVSESIIKNIPMIIPYYIPGQEEENAQFLVDSEAAIKVDEMKEIGYVIDYLIENPEKLEEMRNNMKKIANTHSLDSILELSNRLIKQYKYEWGIANEG
ncbi:MGDG synthase family glycosyltransferase [Caldisalinibacter kiritimatiensis]|uniref:Putative glycosyl transferase n=1 Tax=Caldisalinibacter kiritimatiensis TaxID=1304284 RepID=R1CAX7_9FIRM|nr:glycosyltransferase [Caldisalinibacter kiritimatiensis]EOC99464.1 putative glycosyl transferase [Caldisalinibacter kiritimatiensis]